MVGLNPARRAFKPLKTAWILALKNCNNDNASYRLCAIPIVWRKAKLSRLLMGQKKLIADWLYVGLQPRSPTINVLGLGRCTD